MRPGINLAEHLDREQQLIRTIYISSYLPRKCGIATFTQDLTNAINQLNPDALSEVCAMTDAERQYEYPWEVKFHINQNKPEDYVAATHYINQSSADVVNLQHEFGLFGGMDGEYILSLVDTLEKPLISCFHTILPEPDEHKRHVMKRIISRSEAVIAMSSFSRDVLISQYDCPPEKTVVIQHGVPDLAFTDSERFRRKLRIKSQHMLLVSGLLGADKGFDYVIQAMPAILARFPDTVLYIVGEVHPMSIDGTGRTYYDKLKQLVKENHLSRQVVFVPKFLELEELLDYYRAADIYLTPHLDPQQPTSGTLAKALGCGKVCISTPFFYAQEMLAADAGILVPFRDSSAIASEVNRVLGSPALMLSYRQNAYKQGKKMQWPRVARRYLILFRTINSDESIQKTAS